ncbi:outer membrane lipoprotein carrier protein LolA [Paraburkholderia lycopersici]|uniref:Outer membrane lipoprotein carrier protein LolA n=1 Tax=Paraburkholderia lycopersici TaxID=416944 RepID=A0A1G6M605_9BURK|nr:Outer membrane lipoprotein carrier protein LolA [Paraburkholderia lycopersici]
MNATRYFASARCLCAMASAAFALLTAAPVTRAHAAEAAQPAWTLDRLMSTLAQRKSGRASFTETKYLSIATQPVESSGELVFVAPDHLEKITQSPKPEHLVVDGDMLTVQRDNRTYTLALARYPELGAFIESIRATLAGNRFALEQFYKVGLTGQGDDWTLTLTPLDARMRRVVSSIVMDGTRDALRSVAIQQAGGDRSLMRLQALAAGAN